MHNTTSVQVSVNTDDLDLVARIGALFTGPKDGPIEQASPDLNDAGDPVELPDTPDSPIATETFTDAEYSTGWNDALDTARDEIAANFDALLSAYTEGESDYSSISGKTRVLALIDRRIAEVKR